VESSGDDLTGVELRCPQCGVFLDGIHERCPQCDQPLGEEYCATYHPTASPLPKIIATVFLVGAVFIVVAGLVAWIIS